MPIKKTKKWSTKYKKSINCNRPKGFSQKQYCKYGGNSQLKKKITKKLRNEYLKMYDFHNYLHTIILSIMQFLGYESTSDLSNKINEYLDQELVNDQNVNDEDIINKVIKKIFDQNIVTSTLANIEKETDEIKPYESDQRDRETLIQLHQAKEAEKRKEVFQKKVDVKVAKHPNFKTFSEYSLMLQEFKSDEDYIINKQEEDAKYRKELKEKNEKQAEKEMLELPENQKYAEANSRYLNNHLVEWSQWN